MKIIEQNRKATQADWSLWLVRLSVCLAVALNPMAIVSGEQLKIYLDADFSNHNESSVSIERGIETALQTVNHQLNGRDVVLVRKDHRGNSARSKRHIQQYLNDEQALLIYSGIHSPPLLAHREFINQNAVLYFVPWAAAGPITRYPSRENWIFRLSVDDSKAGELISRYAITERGFKRPVLLLENTGWGKSNHKTMSRSLEQLGAAQIETLWFDWNIKEAGARLLVDQAVATGGDVVFLVANAIEGAQIVRAMAARPDGEGLPVVSHWGIIGGSFHNNVPHSTREKVDLTFIQTSFSFMRSTLNAFQRDVFQRAKQYYPEIENHGDILAPTGFIHAYDLTILLIEAMRQVSLSGDIKSDRAAVRSAMENIPRAVEGLVKTYRQPFGVFDQQNPDAHEALGINDFALAKFNSRNEIVLEPWRYGDPE